MYGVAADAERIAPHIAAALRERKP